VSDALVLGIDVGTSGVRACAVDSGGNAAALAATEMPSPRQVGAIVEQDPAVWWEAAVAAIGAVGRSVDLSRVRRLAVDGTSGTLLLIDAQGRPCSPGLMYNDARAAAEANRVRVAAPPESGAHGASSALAKLLHLTSHGVPVGVCHAVHQADWIAGRLAGRFGVSDENNALKLGYDPVTRAWPDWFGDLDLPHRLLPSVLVPGAHVGRIDPEQAAALGLRADTEIRAGTTDGVAAFVATRASASGDAVTSLGSTLVLKLLSDRPVFSPAQGVYSHRLGDRWLAGGASNSGGAALLAQVTAEQMAALTPRLEPDRPTGLDYYPLPSPGERFPLADPALQPRVSPRPPDDAVFFQGLLEGIAAIEALGYQRLAALGASPLKRVITIGGGARNDAWTAIRARRLGVSVSVAAQTEAAFGAALLALNGGPP
jgi:sugar (pentulose or hexulose) kinase